MSAAAKILRLKRVCGRVYYREGSEEAILRRANAVLREGFALGPAKKEGGGTMSAVLCSEDAPAGWPDGMFVGTFDDVAKVVNLFECGSRLVFVDLPDRSLGCVHLVEKRARKGKEPVVDFKAMDLWDGAKKHAKKAPRVATLKQRELEVPEIDEWAEY